jgi:transcriptional regulator with XRE-family HTH domain
MRLTPDLTDAAVLHELGSRLERRRIDASLTQADLAEQAGTSKRTIERIEAGHSTDFRLLLRTLRALRLFDELDRLVPDLPQSPMTLLKQKGHERKRVGRPRKDSKPRPGQPKSSTWKWAE